MPRRIAAVLGFVALLGVSACGGDDSTGNSSTVTVKDITLTFVAGVNCDTGGVQTEFPGTAGKTVTITASGGSNLTPIFVLYAPDFATQLAGSNATGAGKARIIFAITQTGTHYITACDQNEKGGNVRFTVTQPTF